MSQQALRQICQYVQAAEGGRYVPAPTGLDGEWRELEEAICRLVEEVKSLRERSGVRGGMDRELLLSRAIQNSLLPQDIPHRKGLEFARLYRPANLVSGDYYDLIDIDDQHVGLAVADISGKSLSGGMFMAVTQSALRSQARLSLSPSEVIRFTGKILKPSMKPGFFVSLFYAVLNTETMTMTCANAGHLPLVWYRHKQRDAEWVHPQGVAIGLESYVTKGAGDLHEEKVLSLEPGDLALMVTDGISEAQGSDGRLFSRERVRQRVREKGPAGASELLSLLEREVDSFLAGSPVSDDMAGLAVSRKEALDA